MKNEYTFDPENGVVFGKHGRPFKKRTSGGYVTVHSHGKHIGQAHRMIWEHVHGAIPEGMEINHKNGVKWDNRISNLELVTPSENCLHAYRTGLVRADGVHNGRYKGKRRKAKEAA